MKNPSSRPLVSSDNAPPKVGRRGLVVGAGVAGAAALGAAALYRGAVPPTTVAAAAPVAGEHDGYRLSDHVKRYYETTRT